MHSDKNKILFLVCLTFTLYLVSPVSAAQRLINFQGLLTNQQGNPLDGTYTIKFSLYPSPDLNASPLWTEEHDNVSASKGIVNVLLGSIQSFDEPVKITFDQERYLGITIDCDHDPNTSEPEMTPRQRILPAIYAYTAGTAYNADIAGNADKLDGKDSSEFTTPQTDAGRPGVVQNLYEGNIRLVDKYLRKDEGGNVNISGGLNIAGSVGIGTTNPDDSYYKLAVNGNIHLTAEGENQYYIDGIKGLNSGGGSIHIPGRVGIGTTNPTTKLDVIGDVRMPGYLLTGNSATMNLPAGATYTVLCWGTYFTCEDYTTWLNLDGNNVKSYSGAGTDSAGCDQNTIMTQKTGITGGNHTWSFNRGAQWDFMWIAFRE